MYLLLYNTLYTDTKHNENFALMVIWLVQNLHWRVDSLTGAKQGHSV